MTSLLIVDDNLRDQERYQAFLGDSGVELLICTAASEAFRLIGEQGVRLGAAIVLWELPGQPCGSELLTHLRRDLPDLPVLVVSGLLDLSRAAKARALGAQDFLLKPLERDRLQAAVRLALDGDRHSPLLNALHQRLVGASRPFREMLKDLAAVISRPNETTLLIGENGTGKELLARAVHDLGAVDKRQWVPVNVASIPATLVESTLFGHEAGAFTDARERRIGLFEECGSGTLFLDEIGELDLSLQAKLLRVIQERVFRRVGGSEDLRFKARLVCATNCDLVAEQKAGRFREDLYHRLAGHEVRVPPLRQRGDDLWLLLEHLLKKHAGGRRVQLARETRELLAGYRFPGNVRELEGFINSALGKCPVEEILPYHLPVEIMEQRQDVPAVTPEPAALVWPERLFQLPQKQAVQEIENAFNREYLPRKLQEARGNVTQTARAVGLDPKTFRTKWKQAELGPLSSTE